MDSNLTSKCTYTPAWPDKCTEVTIPTSDMGGPMTWCQRNCTGHVDACEAPFRGTRTCTWLLEYKKFSMEITDKTIEVTIPSLNVNEMWYWCREHCIGKFDAMIAKTSAGRVWLFEYEEDATAFSLVWK